MAERIIEFYFKPDTFPQIQKSIDEALPFAKEIEGLRQVLAIDLGNERGLLVAVFESEDEAEAALKATDRLFGTFSSLVAKPPNYSTGYRVLFNNTY